MNSNSLITRVVRRIGVIFCAVLLPVLIPSQSTGQTAPCRPPNKMYDGQCLHPQKIKKLKAEKAEKAQAEKERKQREAGRRAADDIDWIRIPGGTFQMGSNDGYHSEEPVHVVTVRTFEIAKTETTVAQYRRCVEAGACTALDAGSSECNWGKWDRDNHPVNCMKLNQAAAYAKWVGGRLPTEAEWEYAARSGGRDQKYPWGNQEATCKYAVMWDVGSAGCGRKTTSPVCSKTAGNTSQGLCDMSGNVFEWVQDRWHDSYRGAPSNGSAWEDSGSDSVIRGGSWYSVDGYVRAAYRVNTDNRYSVGLRPARSVP